MEATRKATVQQTEAGTYRVYALVDNIDHTGRKTGGQHWHQIGLDHATRAEAERIAAVHNDVATED